MRSRWILQEVFVHPAVGDGTLKGTLSLEVSSDFFKEDDSLKVAVEIVGLVGDGERQIANLRFVNVSEFSNEKRGKGFLKEVTKEKIKEFLNLVPFYLLKAGIFVEEVKVEV